VAKKYAKEPDISKRTKEEMRKTLNDLIAQEGLGQAEIAELCGWYIRSTGKPDQAKVSSYTTGKKFSFPALIHMLDKAFDMTLVQFIASASNDVSLTLEQTEINKIMDGLSDQQNAALLSTAKSMQSLHTENQKLKTRVKTLRKKT